MKDASNTFYACFHIFLFFKLQWNGKLVIIIKHYPILIDWLIDWLMFGSLTFPSERPYLPPWKMATQDKNHIPWNKYHIPPRRKLSFFDRKTSEAHGTNHLQATVTMLLWMWFLNVWDNILLGLNIFASIILHVCVFLVSFGIIKHL